MFRLASWTYKRHINREGRTSKLGVCKCLKRRVREVEIYKTQRSIQLESELKLRNSEWNMEHCILEHRKEYDTVS